MVGATLLQGTAGGTVLILNKKCALTSAQQLTCHHPHPLTMVLPYWYFVLLIGYQKCRWLYTVNGQDGYVVCTLYRTCMYPMNCQ